MAYLLGDPLAVCLHRRHSIYELAHLIGKGFHALSRDGVAKRAR
ncbi:MAG: hypothetical protein ACJ8R9_19445 [Steroidobacteraceae bacterium]